MVHITDAQRQEIINSLITTDTKAVAPMTFLEELSMVLFFGLGLPGAIFTVPIIVAIIGYIVGAMKTTFLVAAVVLAPLAVWPQRFYASTLYSWMAYNTIKYFSFKMVRSEVLPGGKPRILVAPPHGVFPFGNIVTIIGCKLRKIYSTILLF